VPVLKAALKVSIADDFHWVNTLALALHAASNPCGSVRFAAICGLAAYSLEFLIMTNMSDDDNHHD
jgi:hypothetical protein